MAGRLEPSMSYMDAFEVKKLWHFLIKGLIAFRLNLRKRNLGLIPEPLVFFITYRYLRIFGNSHGVSEQNGGNEYFEPQ
jgi:hypothetical protein